MQGRPTNGARNRCATLMIIATAGLTTPASAIGAEGPESLWNQYPLGPKASPTATPSAPAPAAEPRSTAPVPAAPARVEDDFPLAAVGIGTALGLLVVGLATWLRRRERPARALPAAPRLALPGPVRATGDGAVAEIAWRAREDGAPAFQLRATETHGAPWLGERSPWLSAAGPVLFGPTPGAARAHAVLRAQIIRQGWEPCGQGPEWYSQRFRRVGAVAPATESRR